MASKRPKSSGSSSGIKGKNKDKKQDESSTTGKTSGSGHSETIFPMVLTSATQEMFSCRADEDVTGENPYKLIRKEDIVQDMRMRAAVSDFSPVKQIVLDYPGDELLLVYDRDFTYGQMFYLVLTVEAKEKILIPATVSVDEETSEDQSSDDVIVVHKTPESQPWVSLGSEIEIEEESVKENRPKLKYRISRVRREFGAPINFTDRNAVETKDGFMECTPYQDRNFCINQIERHCGVQAIPSLKSASTQTQWTYPKNMCTQYNPREFSEEEKHNCLQSENLKNFMNSVASRFEAAIQQNEIMDVFVDDWLGLSQEDSVFGGKTDTHLKEYQSFTDLHFSKEKTISNIKWHPTINGLIAVAVVERMSFEERINNATKMLLNPSLILFWSFSDPINPLLLLECPDDVFAFEFCPSNPNIIVGGCMNGQVVLWDISAYVERLQGTRTGGGKNMAANPNVLGFEDKQENETPVVRYCAVAAIENGHKGPITDVQWLPETFEVTRMGAPMENKNNTCIQIVTCSPDCSMLFWDIRAPRTVAHPATDRKQKAEEKPLENPHGVPNTFKHLDLTWKPLVRVTLPKIDTGGEYSPLKFSLQDNTCDSHTGSNADRAQKHAERSEETPQYAQIRVPSAKSLKPLEDFNTKFYVGTEDGELIYTDWKVEKDNDSGRLLSPKPSHRFIVHDGLVNTVRRSPFFKDILLTVGGWTYAIWKEGVMMGPIIQSSCSQKKCTVGYWSQSRPGVFFIGKEDGNIEVWDLLEKTHEPSQTQNITSAQITCIKPWIVSWFVSTAKQHLLAVSDHLGTLHILEIPWTLRSPSTNEKLSMSKYFEKEVERLVYFEKRKEMRAIEKKEMEAEEQRRKMEPIQPEMLPEHVEEENQKAYEHYLSLEKVILKDMGLLPESGNI